MPEYTGCEVGTVTASSGSVVVEESLSEEGSFVVSADVKRPMHRSPHFERRYSNLEVLVVVLVTNR